MNNTNLSIRIDDSLKNDFQKICNELGMDMSTAITIFMKQTTRERRIPFDITLDPMYAIDNVERLRKLFKD